MTTVDATSHVNKLVCVQCGHEYDERPGRYTCDGCGVEGVLEVELDYAAIRQDLTRGSLRQSRDFTHWRYAPLMTVSNSEHFPPLSVGWTPVYKRDDVAASLGLSALWIKDDGQNPTASLKDRASSVGVARALAEGASIITSASTGNAASSLAGSAASTGLKTVIFVPRHAPKGKVAQLRIFGANVFVVDGSYEDAFNLSMTCAAEFGWYNRNCAINPYMVEGKKTVSIELSEQLDWNVPDYVFYAVGDGCSIYGVWKGFRECQELGLTSRMPRIVGVQAEGAAPIFEAWKTGQPLQPIEPQSLADSIAVGTPRNWRKALLAVEKSDGWYMTVSDDEILEAMRRLGRETGVFGEPAGVAGFAGLIKAIRGNMLPPGASAAVIISGNGLKDINSALSAAGDAPHVPPDFGSIRDQMRKIHKMARHN